MSDMEMKAAQYRHLLQFAELVAALDGSVGMSAGAVMELRLLAADHVKRANEL